VCLYVYGVGTIICEIVFNLRPSLQCISQRLVLNHPRGLSQDPDTPGLCDKPLGGEKDQLFRVDCISLHSEFAGMRGCGMLIICVHMHVFDEVCDHIL
jgi:hypothetical protein